MEWQAETFKFVTTDYGSGASNKYVAVALMLDVYFIFYSLF